MKKDLMYEIVEWLLIVGGLNWGLVGVFNFNLVTWLLGAGLFANIIFGVVGLSAIVLAGYKLMGK